MLRNGDMKSIVQDYLAELCPNFFFLSYVRTMPKLTYAQKREIELQKMEDKWEDTHKDAPVKFHNNVNHMYAMYDKLIKIQTIVGYEITVTLDPKRCRCINEAKKMIIAWIHRRMVFAKGLVAYMFMREDHENGWPHLHGIVWFNKDQDNAMTLRGGRHRTSAGTWVCNELEIRSCIHYVLRRTLSQTERNGSVGLITV